MRVNGSRAFGQYHGTTGNLEARIALHAFGTNPQGWFPWLAARLPVEGDVLEVGAGTGLLWANLPPAAPVLTDFSPAMCARLRTVPGARVVRCGAAELPFPNGSFDTVIANHMLYHLDDPDAALRELTRVLREHGRLAVTTNGADHLLELHALRADAAPAHIAFAAETAPSRVARLLPKVTVERYPCDLAVPDVEPVLAYLASTGPVPPAARHVVQTEIDERGAFDIRKHVVLITAERPQ